MPPSKSRKQKKPVGIWIRVSTEDQARGESPKNHEARARSYAESRDWDIIEIYRLEAVSGKSVKEHPEAQRMLSDVRRGHISGLIFSKLARLARNTRELLEFADIFEEEEADLVSIQESIDTSNPVGRLFFTLTAALAQWEREEIADRVKASIVVRAKLGKSLGGPAPFGFAWIDGKLEVDENEAPTRKLMYELFDEHRRSRTVARFLNERGYRTRKGARFSDTTVTRLIEDPSGKGTYRANHTFRDKDGKLKPKPESDWIHTPVKRIVSDALWDRCNRALLARKEKRPSGRPVVRLFSGLLCCGKCSTDEREQKMYVFSRTLKYVCSKCRNKIAMDDIEFIFQEELEQFFASPASINRHLASAKSQIVDKRALLDANQKKLSGIRKEQDKVYELYLEKKITPNGFGKRYGPLEKSEAAISEEITSLNEELTNLETNKVSTEEVVAEAQNLKASWPKLATEHKRRIIESITEKITISDDTINISLSCLPSSEEFTKRQRNLWGS